MGSELDNINGNVSILQKDVAVLQNEMENLKEQVGDLSDMKEAVTRLVLLQERSEKREEKVNKMQEEQLVINTKFLLSLDNINENLNILNSETKETKEEVNQLKIKVEQRGWFNFSEIKNKLVTGIFIIGIVAIVVYGKEILKLFNINLG